MGRRKKLDLLNPRLQLSAPFRVLDSLDFMQVEPIYLNDCGVRIPFMSKPERVESEFRAWKRGKMKGGGSQDPPVIDNHGNFYEVGKAVELGPATVLIFNRKYNEYDYLENETARIYYCQKKRINTPAMNRVMDNTHEVVTETLAGRVEQGAVPGGSWTTTERLSSTPFSPVGPGAYDINAFEFKYGPRNSNLLQFLSAPSGRNVDESNRRPTKAERHRARKLLTTAGGDFATRGRSPLSRSSSPKSPSPSPERIQQIPIFTQGCTPPMLPTRAATATGAPNTGFGTSDRWKSPLYRTEKYTKTTGAKLAPDYDAAMRDRERVPPKFTTMPQRYEPKRDNVDIEVNVDYGPKACLATAALQSPIKYSMAFRSKAPVGMHIPETTSPSHLGPGAFPLPPGLEVKNPKTPSIPFMVVNKTKSLKEPEEVPSIFEQLRPFSAANSSGPVFSRAGTGAGLVLQQRVEKQVTSMYPRLGNRLYPKPKIEKVDPWAHLRAKRK